MGRGNHSLLYTLQGTHCLYQPLPCETNQTETLTNKNTIDMSDLTMILTEAMMVLLALIAVLSGAWWHLFFLIGGGILLISHINQYSQLKDNEDANI